MRIWTLLAIATVLLIACLPINPQPYIIILLLCYLMMTLWHVFVPRSASSISFKRTLIRACAVLGVMCCALYSYERLEQKLTSRLPAQLDHQIVSAKGVITANNIRSNLNSAQSRFSAQSIKLDVRILELEAVSGLVSVKKTISVKATTSFKAIKSNSAHGQKVRLSYYPLGFGYRRYADVNKYSSMVNHELAPKKLLAKFGAGKVICFEAKLRRPRGLLNFTGFDYEKWLIEQGYYATGYIKSLEEDCNSNPKQSLPWYQAWRLSVIDSLNQVFDSQVSVKQVSGKKAFNQQAILAGGWRNSDVMLALITGSKERLSQARKEWLMQAGLTHLIVISGLHIGLIMAFVYWLAYQFTHLINHFSGRFAGFLLSPRISACFLASVSAWGYCLLAGFSASATRAAIMGTALCIARAYGLRWPVLSGLLLAMLVLLLINPLNALSSGFWLSFGAVFMIYWALIFARLPSAADSKMLAATGTEYAVIRTGKRIVNGLWQLVKVQAALLLLLTPIVLFTVETYHPASFLTNMLCVPVFSVIVVPALLLNTLVYFVWPSLSLLGFELINALLSLIFSWVDVLMATEMSLGLGNMGEWFIFDGVTLCLSLLAFMLLVYFRSAMGLIPLFLLVPLLAPADKSPAYGEATIDLFDVGQGLSLAVRTQNYRLIYDTGPQFDGFDMGEQVVVPMLRYRARGLWNIKESDLVISHADLDHAGGVQSVLSYLSHSSDDEVDLYSGEPERLARTWLSDTDKVTSCHGQSWQRDGVTFTFLSEPSYLYESKQLKSRSNNHSCVLKISTQSQSILMTGDIERRAERALLSACKQSQDCENLKADVLVVGHHGSKTSSSAMFIDAIKPKLAIVSAGYKNRFRHPHPTVVQRFEQREVRLLSTAQSGGIRIKLKSRDEEPLIEITEARQGRHRPWYLKTQTLQSD